MAPSEEPRYVVTGGAGFIGSHLSEALLARGARVDALDDLSTGRHANIAHLGGGPRFRFIRGDAGDRELVRRLLQGAAGVFHLAAAVGVRLVVERPVETIERNLVPTEVVLTEAARLSVRAVLASTSEVYGRGDRAPFDEEQDLVIGPPTRARWAYATSKLLDEFLALALARERGLRVAVARLFNTVGPRQTGRYGMVLPRLCAQARAGGPLTVYGDGSQSRTFADVADVVRGLCLLMERPEAAGEVVNLGGREEIAIGALAERVRARVAPDASIAHVPYEEAYAPGFEDMHRRVPRIDKARALLGWEPTIGLDETIDRVAAALEEGEG